ncbi:hypothetical protein [Ralstonia sp. ASV6]|uniref:hypothetical protein n=1 Tax=Ralstonia sp. ASV6 TaxID=2795124 RepID=UPI0018EBCB6D|nr:hypothetical protein [Ralstonia sp. ASV6]
MMAFINRRNDKKEGVLRHGVNRGRIEVTRSKTDEEYMQLIDERWHEWVPQAKAVLASAVVSKLADEPAR